LFQLDEGIDKPTRLVTSAEINGVSVRLMFDTGAAMPLALFPRAAERLGVQAVPLSSSKPTVDSKPEPGTMNVRLTTPFRFRGLGLSDDKLESWIMEIPTWVPVHNEPEGIVGWPAARSNILYFALEEGIVAAALEKTPDALPGWTKLSLLAHEDTLILRFEEQIENSPFLIFDTGYEGGLLLAPEIWQEWSNAHPEARRTLVSGWMSGQEMRSEVIAWAEEIAVGKLVFHGVAVGEADPAFLRHTFGRNVVVIGVEALKRMELIVDNGTGIAYATMRSTPPNTPKHNRVGATFLPLNRDATELVAQVLPGSPAAAADLRDGDILLRVNGRDVTGWRENPEALQIDTWSRPAGTTLLLTLKRDGRKILRFVTTRDLLGPQKEISP
jgi:predicted aspartyl protease